MDLVHQVAANLEIDAGKAEQGIGAILMALRMNLDGETFKKVKHVLPNSESLMGRALMGGARTGEMAALVGPAGLLARSRPRAIRKTTSRDWGAWCSSTCGPLSGGRSSRNSCEPHRCCSRSSRFAASVPPPDLPQPLCHLALSRGPVGRRALGPPRYRLAPAAQIMGERSEADRPPARVDPRRVLERQGTQPSLLVPIELGTVALRPTFEAADPVFEHGDLQWRDFALARPAPEQRQPPAHRQRRRTPVRVTGTRAGAPWNSAGGSAIPWVRPVVAAP